MVNHVPAAMLIKRLKQAMLVAIAYWAIRAMSAEALYQLGAPQSELLHLSSTPRIGSNNISRRLPELRHND
jgi:hypothetical protein